MKENPYLKEDKVCVECQKPERRDVYELPCSDQQKGRNVLHRVCSGPEGSVETLQWLLEVMPHLKTPEILNEGKNVSILSVGCEKKKKNML